MNGPLVSAIWFSDPDGVAHSDGIGAATSMAVIKNVDEQFGRIISYLESEHLIDQFNIIISADHGFVTHIGKIGLAQFLIKEGLKKDSTSTDVVVSEAAIYVKDHNQEMIKKIVSKLQEQLWIGSVFTKPANHDDTKGWVEGTVSFDVIHWNHERSGDILVDYNWNDDKNNMGYPGTSYNRGVAGHGGLSPYEVHIALLAAGPSFKKSFESELPTSNVDITPTILHIHHIDIPAEMDGRVMNELLIEKNKSAAMKVTTDIITTNADINGTDYQLTVHTTLLGKYRYVDFAKAIRTLKK